MGDEKHVTHISQILSFPNENEEVFVTSTLSQATRVEHLSEMNF